VPLFSQIGKAPENRTIQSSAFLYPLAVAAGKVYKCLAVLYLMSCPTPPKGLISNSTLQLYIHVMMYFVGRGVGPFAQRKLERMVWNLTLKCVILYWGYFVYNGVEGGGRDCESSRIVM